MFSINDIFDLAIKIEQNGEEVYRNAQRQASNPTSAELLTWMADQEKEHAQWFSAFKKENLQILDNPIKAEMNRAILGEMMGKRTFSLKIEDLLKMNDLTEILLLSIEFEKDTVIFYEMMQAFLQEEADQTHLKLIVAEEKSQIQQLQEMLD